MSEMFENTLSFNKPLNKWNVYNVMHMNNMFNGAESFNQDINNWNVSLETDMSDMFSNSGMNQLPIWYRNRYNNRPLQIIRTNTTISPSSSRSYIMITKNILKNTAKKEYRCQL